MAPQKNTKDAQDRQDDAKALENQQQNMSGDHTNKVQVSDQPTPPQEAQQVRTTRGEEGEWAATEVRDQLLKQREEDQRATVDQMRQQANQQSQMAQRPVVVTDAVIRSAMAAQAQLEAGELRLDHFNSADDVKFVVNGVQVDSNGMPLSRKK